MTAKEVKDYLNRHLQDIQGDIYYINALSRYVAKYEPYMHNPRIRGICLAWYDRIRAERVQLDRKRLRVKKWAELISDPVHRQIFTERYIDALQWEDIEIKNSYSPSNVFRIHNQCCAEIAKKLREIESRS